MLLDFEKIKDFFRRTSHWKYAPLLLMGLSIIDYFILILPSDAFLLAAILGAPQRVLVFCMTMIVGKMLGVWCSSILAAYLPVQTFYSFVSLYHLESVLENCRSYFEKYGPLSIGITSLTPLPLQFISVISSAAGASLWKLQLWLLLGQSLRYLILASGLLGTKIIYKAVVRKLPRN